MSDLTVADAKKAIKQEPKAKDGRRLYSDAFIAMCVEILNQDGANVSQFAEDIGIAPALLYRWRKQANLLNRKPKRGTAAHDSSPLPTTKSGPPRPSRSKALVPVAFACPHCGGHVTLDP